MLYFTSIHRLAMSCTFAGHRTTETVRQIDPKQASRALTCGRCHSRHGCPPTPELHPGWEPHLLHVGQLEGVDDGRLRRHDGQRLLAGFSPEGILRLDDYLRLLADLHLHHRLLQALNQLLCAQRAATCMSASRWVPSQNRRWTQGIWSAVELGVKHKRQVPPFGLPGACLQLGQ